MKPYHTSPREGRGFVPQAKYAHKTLPGIDGWAGRRPVRPADRAGRPLPAVSRPCPSLPSLCAGNADGRLRPLLSGPWTPHRRIPHRRDQANLQRHRGSGCREHHFAPGARGRRSDRNRLGHLRPGEGFRTAQPRHLCHGQPGTLAERDAPRRHRPAAGGGAAHRPGIPGTGACGASGPGTHLHRRAASFGPAPMEAGKKTSGA